MEYNIAELRSQIGKYIHNHLTLSDLGQWATQAYWDLLHGGYFDLEKLSIYPYIKLISQSNSRINEITDSYPCSKDDIIQIYKVLCGEISENFYVQIAVSNSQFQVPSDLLSKIEMMRTVLCSFEDSVCEIKIDIRTVELIASLMRSNKPRTIFELIECYISSLFYAIFEYDVTSMHKKQELRLYSPKSNQKMIIDNLIRCLDTFCNNENFCFLVSINDGSANVSLIV